MQLSQYLQAVLSPQLEGVFTIIKPGFLDKVGDIIKKFEAEGWCPCRTTIKQLQRTEAEELYKVHKDEEWYDNLCEYMSSGPSRAIMFINENASNPFEEVAKIKDQVREKWGIDDCKNVMHSSDSRESQNHESSIYF